MEENNGDGQKGNEEEPSITARLNELSRTSNEAIHFLLSKYKETKINAVHSIRQQIPILKKRMRGRRKRDERE